MKCEEQKPSVLNIRRTKFNIYKHFDLVSCSINFCFLKSVNIYSEDTQCVDEESNKSVKNHIACLSALIFPECLFPPTVALSFLNAFLNPKGETLKLV